MSDIIFSVNFELKITLGPGIYDGISNEDYHNKHNGISKSGLCQILKSPSHYWAAYLDPDREPFIQTEAMRIGSAAHKMTLEPDEFFNEYETLPAVIADMNKNRKDYKEYVADIRARKKIPLSPKDLERTRKIANSVKSHPKAKGLLAGGKAEQSAFWIDPDTGVLCKCRPDYWKPGMAIPDLKKTTDVRASKFSKSCANYDYHIQAAFYSDGIEVITGEELPMPFIAVEEDPPFAVNVFVVDSEGIDCGRSEYKRALEAYAQCLETSVWPSYPPEITTISLPAWKHKQYDI